MQEAGADVTVTIRQYRSGVVNIPLGCKRINYGDRMEYMPQCDLVVSATASPNFTLKEELFQGIRTKDDLILIDLAVPRDIEPSVGKIQGVTLYDMDSVHRSARYQPFYQSFHYIAFVSPAMVPSYETRNCHGASDRSYPFAGSISTIR